MDTQVSSLRNTEIGIYIYLKSKIKTSSHLFEWVYLEDDESIDVFFIK